MKHIISENSIIQPSAMLERDAMGNILTPEQTAFFANSVVRNKNGQLLVMRHATAAEFSEFNQPLNWFSADFEYVAQYASKDHRLNYDVYLNCVNPLYCGDTDLRCYAWTPLTRPYQLSRELKIISRNAGISEAELLPILEETERNHPGYDENPDEAGYGIKLFELIRKKSFVDLVCRAGFDSFKTYEGPKHALCYGVFSDYANKIKSIDTEEPTNSANIYESLKTEELPKDVHWWRNPEDGAWNPTEVIDGRRARLRAGILIVKDGTEVLLGEEASEPGVFSLPGGAINKGETIAEAGVREAEEETFTKVKNAKYTGITYMTVCDEVADWVKEHVPEKEWWIDYKTFLTIGEYDGEYEGTVNEPDIDASMESTSRFYKIKDAIKDPSFKKEWKQALIDFGYLAKKDLKEAVNDSALYATESPYEIKNKLMSEQGKVYRIIDDPRLDKFFLANADIFTHVDMLQTAIDDGWYDPELFYGEDDQQFLTYLDECPTYVFVQKDANDWRGDDFYWMDGYFDRYDYSFGQLYAKGNEHDTKLGKALGKPISHYVLTGFIGNKPQIKLAPLTEATRSQLVSQSRNAGAYKDASRGKNRFERKKYSKVASQVKSYNQIDMNQFFKQDILEVKIPVTGETKEYVVTVKLNGVVAEMARNIKSNQNKFEYKTVLQALTKVFNTTDVYVKDTCPDFRFRFAHWAIVNNYSADGTDKDPGPGRGIANPKNDMGKGCKHILLVLNNQDWIMKVTSVIHNYINYAEEHMMKPFQQVIFPKLYGMHIDEAVEAGLVPEDTKLDTEKHIIEVINDWAKNRGKYKPGTNRNPVNDKRS